MVKVTKNFITKTIKKHKKSKHCNGECLEDFIKQLSKRISSRSGKNKGAKLQNRIAFILANSFNLTFGKDEDLQGREMGQSGVDIRMSKDAKKIIPFDIEVKNCETWSVPMWWKQCVNNTSENRMPLLVVSKNNHEDLAILKIEDLIHVMKNVYRHIK
jgi:hypothetical protein